MEQAYKLYGMAASLYTGKVRSYLIKQGIPFEEHCAGDPYFQNQIIPQIGRWIIPVIETQDGAVLQDGADIIDHFEAKRTAEVGAFPLDPRLKAAAYLFELYGGEGMLRPAMHYRWNFDEENLEFIRRDFAASLAPVGDAALGEQIFQMAATRMRRAMGSFGVKDASIPKIEASFCEFLKLFDNHLETMPYLLGNSPTIGDYGLIAPLYAHLGRDPAPSTLMKQVAPRVFRWVERMNAPDKRIPEYLALSNSCYDVETIISSIENLMGFVAEDYLPELLAHVDFANAWLAERPNLEEGSLGLEGPGDRIIGSVSFIWREVEIKTTVMPYRFYMLQRLQDAVAAMSEQDAEAVQQLFERTGCGAFLTAKVDRRVERRNNLEVWGHRI